MVQAAEYLLFSICQKQYLHLTSSHPTRVVLDLVVVVVVVVGVVGVVVVVVIPWVSPWVSL